MAILAPEYGRDWVLAVTDVVAWAADVTANGIYYAPDCVVALAFISGCALGAWAPDYTEITIFCNGNRHSFIPHRTLTHTVALWSVLVAIAVGLMVVVDTAWDYILSWLFLGFTLAGLLHVMIDMLSPTGVPLIRPFGPRVSFRVYRTGDISEMKVTLPILCSCIATIMML